MVANYCICIKIGGKWKIFFFEISVIFWTKKSIAGKYSLNFFCQCFWMFCTFLWLLEYLLCKAPLKQGQPFKVCLLSVGHKQSDAPFIPTWDICNPIPLLSTKYYVFKCYRISHMEKWYIFFCKKSKVFDVYLVSLNHICNDPRSKNSH